MMIHTCEYYLKHTVVGLQLDISINKHEMATNHSNMVDKDQYKT